MDPNFAQTRLSLGLAYVHQSMFDEAIAEFQKVISLLGRDSGALAAMGYTYAISGRKIEAKKLLDELKEQSQRRYIAPYRLAIVCAGLGETDQAFAWLGEGLRGTRSGIGLSQDRSHG
jgi:tetratricopeptide (TPR) repeat protein